ncbi:MAG: PAS domain-containing protein [Caulobacter sp.]|nr:PAS domain-containing protein [Caulobacter sp.]
MTEEDRLSVLRGLGALDSESDPRFDRIVRLAAALFRAPRASVLLVDSDRLWHKASIGVPRSEYPRAGTLADVMMARNEVLISGDIRADGRFDEVRQGLTQVDVRFYAAAPLTTADGAVVGLLAVGDPEPHPTGDDTQLEALKDLAAVTMDLLLGDARRLAAERGLGVDMRRRRLAVEAAQLGELEWDIATDRLIVDDNMRSMTGLSWDEEAGQGGAASYAFVHPDDREALQSQVAVALQETGVYRAEYRIVRPDNGQTRWMMGAGAMLRDDQGAPSKVVGVVQDITERKWGEEQRELLLAELDHRVKNILATVQSLAAQTARRSESVPDYVERFTGRLRAMAKAHEFLGVSRRGGASLQATVESELEGLANRQAMWAGPELFLTPRAANALSLALHELTTNAVKYGALSTEGGRVLIDWRRRPGGGFLIDWIETGGPPVQPPDRTGFGTALLERVTGRELGGNCKITYGREGVRVLITAGPNALDAPESPSKGQPGAEVRIDNGPGPAGVDGLNLLIVEDATLLALELEAGLTEAGARVVGAAADVEEALVLAEGDLDAAVLDVNLGGQMIGPVAERLQARGIPFVFATGYGEQRMPALFNAPVVRKPYDIQQIVRAVAGAVGR